MPGAESGRESHQSWRATAARGRGRFCGATRITGGLVLPVGLGQAQAIERLGALSSVAGKPGPHPRRDPGGRDRELLTVLDGRLAGKSWRETAVDLYGARRVAGDWHTDGWMRSRVRRRDRKARSLMEGGYRDLVAGR